MNFFVNRSYVQRYRKDGPAKEGGILLATFELNGSRFACSDSYIKHEWTFTPGISNWVDCKSDQEIENLYSKLSVNGNVIFPLDSYSFSPKFAFLKTDSGFLGN
ncbi:MAG: VOC family protein [Bacteroidota bacterium]